MSVHGARIETEGANFILFNFAGPLQDPVTGDISRAAEIIDFAGDYFTARVDHTWDTTIYDGGNDAFPKVTNQLLASVDFDRQAIEGTRILSGHSSLDPANPVYTGYQPQPLLPGFPTTFSDDKFDEGEATSILLLDRVAFGDSVILSFGGRYEWFDAKSQLTFAPDDIPFGNSDNELYERTFNPTVGILGKITPNVSLFGSYSESTFSFQNIGLSTVDGDKLDEERSRAYEVGAKAEALDGRLLATTALFQIEKTDVATTDPDNPFFSINGGEQRSRGVEFDIGGEPIPGWRVTANYAYIDSEITDDPSGETTGNRLFGVPEHSGGLFTTYEIQQGPLAGFGAGGGVFASDDVEADNFKSATLSGWEQFDAVAFYRREHLVVQLNVKNLTDEEYLTPGSAGGAEGIEVYRAQARTVLGSVRVEF